MQHILDLVHQYHDQILIFMKSVIGAGILDVILKKVPTQKPMGVLLGARKILGFVGEICLSVDDILDAIPGMSQNLKTPAAPAADKTEPKL